MGRFHKARALGRGAGLILVIAVLGALAAPAVASAGTSITSGPSAVSNNRSATFTFTYSGAGKTGFNCSLSGPGNPGTPAACNSGTISYAGLAGGEYTFSVAATGIPLLVDTTPALYRFVIDLTPPDTTITSGPSGIIGVSSATFTFGSTESSAASFRCTLDGSAPSVCNGGTAMYSGLANGPHVFTVAAIDFAGNVDPTPATRSFSVDTTPGVPTITGGPSGLTNVAAPIFGVAAGKPGGVLSCSVDGLAPSSCGPTYQPPPLVDGPHLLTVSETDPGGAGRTATRAFTTDTIAPDTTIRSIAAGQNVATIEFSGSEAGSFQCSFDGGAFTACASPVVYRDLVGRDHRIAILETDKAGNKESAPATASVANIPAARVALRVLTDNPRSRRGVRIDASGSSSETPIARYEFDYGDGSKDSTTVPLVAHAYQRPGRYTISAVLVDRAGRRSSPTKLSVRVADGDPPTVNIRNPHNRATLRRGSALTLSGVVSDISGIGSVQVALRVLPQGSARICRWYDGHRFTRRVCSSALFLRAKVSGHRWSLRIPRGRLARGAYELRVRATDRAGIRTDLFSVRNRTIIAFLLR